MIASVALHQRRVAATRFPCFSSMDKFSKKLPARDSQGEEQGALLLTTAMAVTAPAWSHWTAFGEDGRNAVRYVEAESIGTAGELGQVWAMKYMTQPVIGFDLAMQSLYEVECAGRRHRLVQYQSFKGRMGGDPTRGGMLFGDWMTAGSGTVGSGSRAWPQAC